jgi:hypothetical protein
MLIAPADWVSDGDVGIGMVMAYSKPYITTKERKGGSQNNKRTQRDAHTHTLSGAHSQS